MDNQQNPNSAFSNRGEMLRPDASQIGDGERASEIMRGNEAPFDRPRENSPLDMFSEMQRRLSAVEASQASIHKKIDDATKAGTLDPKLLENVAHVMGKYFPHEMPAPVVIEAPRPKFDAFTGERLN